MGCGVTLGGKKLVSCCRNKMAPAILAQQYPLENEDNDAFRTTRRKLHVVGMDLVRGGRFEVVC